MGCGRASTEIETPSFLKDDEDLKKDKDKDKDKKKKKKKRRKTNLKNLTSNQVQKNPKKKKRIPPKMLNKKKN